MSIKDKIANAKPTTWLKDGISDEEVKGLIKNAKSQCGLISRRKLIRDLFYQPNGNPYPTRDCDNFPITISFEDLRKVINNQPQVQLIVRTPEEVTEMLNKISCPDCDRNSSHCHFSESDCNNYWYEWLTGKEV